MATVPLPLTPAVIPAHAGIQRAEHRRPARLDSRVRGKDGRGEGRCGAANPGICVGGAALRPIPVAREAYTHRPAGVTRRRSIFRFCV